MEYYINKIQSKSNICLSFIAIILLVFILTLISFVLYTPLSKASDNIYKINFNLQVPAELELDNNINIINPISFTSNEALEKSIIIPRGPTINNISNDYVFLGWSLTPDGLSTNKIHNKIFYPGSVINNFIIQKNNNTNDLSKIFNNIKPKNIISNDSDNIIKYFDNNSDNKTLQLFGLWQNVNEPVDQEILNLLGYEPIVYTKDLENLNNSNNTLNNNINKLENGSTIEILENNINNNKSLMVSESFTNNISIKSANIDYTGASVLDGPITKDGSTIENIHVKWLTGNNEKYFTVNSTLNDEFAIRASVNFALSGEKSYRPGTINIHIPDNIMINRYLVPDGYMTFGIPENPITTSDFSWKKVNNEYIFTNTKELDGGTAGAIEFSYQGLIPSDFVSGRELEPLQAKIELTTHKGNTISMISEKITGQINTDTIIVNAHADTGYVKEDPPTDWPVGLPTNPDNYIYISWYTNATVTGNQPYKINATVNPPNDGGIVLGKRSQDLYEGFQSTSARHGTYFYIAYPKSSYNINKHTYTFNNSITWTVTTLDTNHRTTQIVNPTTTYTPLWWIPPGGHYMIWKFGTDKEFETNGRWAIPESEQSGSYPYAMNALLADNPVNLNYKVDWVAYTGPWTLRDNVDSDQATRSDYGHKPVRVEITDTNTYLDRLLSDHELTSEDLSIKSIKLYHTMMYDYRKGETGLFAYYWANNSIPQPPINLYGKSNNGQWKQIAIFNSDQTITVMNGAKLDGNNVIPPKGTQDWKSDYTTKTFGMKGFFQVSYNIQPTEKIKKIIRDISNQTETPRLWLYNDVNFKAFDSFGREIVSLDKTNRNQMLGASLAAYANKTLDYKSNPQKRVVELKYTLNINEVSNISDFNDYKMAMQEKYLLPETKGIFWDLLPKGAILDNNSLEVRPGDTILSVKTFKNWRNSGRDMLKVDTRLVPKPYLYHNPINGLDVYADAPKLSYKCTYIWEELSDASAIIDNHFAFESGNPYLGTVQGAKGEPDNPLGGQNDESKTNTIGAQSLMTDINNEHNKPVFLYGRNSNEIVFDKYSLVNLSKRVTAPGMGHYTTGLDDNDKVIVPVGGIYTYHLRQTSAEDTTTKDIIFFDAIDSFIPTEDHSDYGAQQFKGTFSSIDISNLEAKGINPKIYYATSEVDLSKEQNLNILPWTTQLPSNKADIKAIAIDATYKQDGTKFELAPGDGVSIYINVRAPLGEQADSAINNNAYAFNNVYLSSTQINKNKQAEHKYIHQDYTKVGIAPFKLTIKKIWDDDNDRDGIRPSIINATLLQNGINYKTIILNKDNHFTIQLNDIPFADENGTPYEYIVKDVTDGYEAGSLVKSDEPGNYTVFLRNIHIPKKIIIKGNKKWIDNNPEITRPSSLKLFLLANNKIVDSTTTSSDRNWQFNFGEQYVFSDEGKPIVYTIQEEGADDYYLSDDTIQGLTNTYDPYTDINISKETIGATEQALKYATFKIKFTLLDEYDKDSPYEYNYTTKLGKKGTIKSGQELELVYNDVITIHKVHTKYYYNIEENTKTGWKLIDGKELKGKLKSHKTVNAILTNKYYSQGRGQIDITKLLNGRKLDASTFKFILFEKDEQNKDHIIAASYNKQGTNRTIDNKDRINESAQAQFMTPVYTEKDSGKTFTYYIKEINENKPGYTYDNTIHTITVVPTDTGTGKMSISINYQNNKQPIFNNNYRAKGTVPIDATKFIKSRILKDKEFKFELLNNNGDILQSQYNDQFGTIRFIPLQFTEQHIDKTFTYYIRESQGTDNTVNYDNHLERIIIKVSDRGNGQLSFDMSTNIVDNINGNIIPYNNDKTPLVFNNTLKDGSLSIQKYTLLSDKQTETRDSEEFEYTIKFKNANGDPLPDGNYKYDLELAEPYSEYVINNESNNSILDNNRILENNNNIIHNRIEETFNNNRINNNINIIPNTIGLMDYTAFDILPLASNTNLEISNELNQPAVRVASQYMSVTNWDDITIKKRSWETWNEWLQRAINKHGPILNDYGNPTGYNTVNHTNIYGTQFQDGTFIIGINSNNSTIEVNQLKNRIISITRYKPILKIYTPFDEQDTNKLTIQNTQYSEYGEFKRLFQVTAGGEFITQNMKSLTEYIDLSGITFRNMINTNSMFGGLDSLIDLRLPKDFGQQMGTVVDATGMFHLGKMEYVDFSGWNTSSLQDASTILNGNYIKYADLSGWDVSRAKEILGWSELQSLNVLKLNGWGNIPRNVDTKYFMYRGRGHLDEIDIRTWNNITNNNGNVLVNLFENNKYINRITVSNNSINMSKNNLGKSIWGDDQPIFTVTYKYSMDNPGCYWKNINTGEKLSHAQFLSTTLSGGTWEWTEPLVSVKQIVYYSANGGSGSMSDSQVTNPDNTKPTSITIKKNTFWKTGYKFTGWNTSADGTGESYNDQDTIIENIKYNNIKILYAQWEKIDTKATMRNGIIKLKLRGGEKATFNNLPAGTTYEIIEKDSTNNWKLYEKYNTSGIIQPVEIQKSVFKNIFSPNIAIVNLKFNKEFYIPPNYPYIPAIEGYSDINYLPLQLPKEPFTFELIDLQTNKTIQKVQNSPMGNINFQPLIFDKPGVYDYKVVELPDTNHKNTYFDQEPRCVRITVTKQGDKLVAKENYAVDLFNQAIPDLKFDNQEDSKWWYTFFNRNLEQGSLIIEKAYNNNWGAQSGEILSNYAIKLTNPDGTRYRYNIKLNKNSEGTVDNIRNGVIVTDENGIIKISNVIHTNSQNKTIIHLEKIAIGTRWEIIEDYNSLYAPIYIDQQGHYKNKGIITNNNLKTSIKIINTAVIPEKVNEMIDIEAIKTVNNKIPTESDPAFEFILKEHDLYNTNNNDFVNGEKIIENVMSNKQTGKIKFTPIKITADSENMGLFDEKYKLYEIIEKPISGYILDPIKYNKSDDRYSYVNDQSKRFVLVKISTNNKVINVQKAYIPIKPTLEDAQKLLNLKDAIHPHIFNNINNSSDIMITKNGPEIPKNIKFGFIVNIDTIESNTEIKYITNTGREGTFINQSKDPDKVLQLASGETAKITGIIPGSKYNINELPGAYLDNAYYPDNNQYYLINSDNNSGITSIEETQLVTFLNGSRNTNLSGNATIKVNKKMTGAPLLNQQFAFVLINSEGTVIDQARNDESGNVIFKPLLFSLNDINKTFKYTIKETMDGQPSIKYDNHELQVNITPVISEDNSKIITNVEYIGKTTFLNEHALIMPEAGLSGINILTLTGLLLLMIGVLLIIKNNILYYKK